MPRTVADLLHLHQQRAADVALACGGEQVSFGELGDRVRAAASALLSEGVVPGDRVALLLPRGIEECVQLLAVMVTGAVAVPVHTKLRDDQVRHVLVDAAPRLCVAGGERLLGLRNPDEVLRDVTAVAPSGPDGAAELPADRPGPSDNDPAVILYTSGSTGLAKGIVQSHGNLALGAEVVAQFLSLGAEDHVLSLLSFSFDYGLNQLLGALWVGCRLTIADHLGPGELAGLLREHRPTGLAGVPSLWHEVAAGLRGGVLTDADGSSLRYVTNSGGALQLADSGVLRRAWPHVDVHAMYGLTEAFRSASLPPAEFDEAPESFGYPIAGVDLLLVCPETGGVLEGAATGELVHTGALVATGYWQRPEESAQRFRPDPRGGGGRAVYSGDLVRRDERGRHYFVARMDRMLKVQGHRVSPDEVASGVVGAPGVGDVAVLGLDGGADGHRIAVVVAGDPSDPGLVQRLLRRCRTRLPSYMQPAVVRVLEQLPHNANGKVDQAALRGML